MVKDGGLIKMCARRWVGIDVKELNIISLISSLDTRHNATQHNTTTLQIQPRISLPIHKNTTDPSLVAMATLYGAARVAARGAARGMSILIPPLIPLYGVPSMSRTWSDWSVEPNFPSVVFVYVCYVVASPSFILRRDGFDVIWCDLIWFDCDSHK